MTNGGSMKKFPDLLEKPHFLFDFVGVAFLRREPLRYADPCAAGGKFFFWGVIGGLIHDDMISMF